MHSRQRVHQAVSPYSMSVLYIQSRRTRQHCLSCFPDPCNEWARINGVSLSSLFITDAWIKSQKSSVRTSKLSKQYSMPRKIQSPAQVKFVGSKSKHPTTYLSGLSESSRYRDPYGKRIQETEATPCLGLGMVHIRNSACSGIYRVQIRGKAGCKLGEALGLAGTQVPV